MEWLPDYATGSERKMSPQKDHAQDPPTPPRSSRSICFLCPKNPKLATFRRRSELTRHWVRNHATRTFNLLFTCPECVCLDNKEYLYSVRWKRAILLSLSMASCIRPVSPHRYPVFRHDPSQSNSDIERKGPDYRHGCPSQVGGAGAEEDMQQSIWKHRRQATG
ncbi:hypothetical protein CONLIGDRAFT_414615 [Coniochaeta ligniaria NRRL 30616]|uniref:Uncharacterized protein n=1 Tax=Coniochaeta ligniaria NRRL 30616 TaxID=1408157 RepID=A0A1J7I3S5_9PEZI|nr:hypothetical protein CONLIGDRAFT_414615 [Coniochaeta ligniaria NRRL 30616]